MNLQSKTLEAYLSITEPYQWDDKYLPVKVLKYSQTTIFLYLNAIIYLFADIVTFVILPIAQCKTSNQ